MSCTKSDIPKEVYTNPEDFPDKANNTNDSISWANLAQAHHKEITRIQKDHSKFHLCPFNITFFEAPKHFQGL